MNKNWWDSFCLFGEIQKNCILVFSTQNFIIFSHFSSLSPGFEATTWISRLTVLREKTKLNSTITQSMWGSAGWNWMMMRNFSYKTFHCICRMFRINNRRLFCILCAYSSNVVLLYWKANWNEEEGKEPWKLPSVYIPWRGKKLYVVIRVREI